MKTLTILCDIDEILANLLNAWIFCCNTKLSRKSYMATGKAPEKIYSKDDMKVWGIEKCIPLDPGVIYSILDTPKIFFDLQPLPGALEALKRIQDKGHEVLLITASAKNPQIAADKISWVRKYMPWLNQDNFFLGRKKYKLRGDVLIDDAPKNLTLHKQHWPDTKLVTIHYPYNEDVKGLVDLYAESYTDTTAAWLQIEEYINKLSHGE